MNHRILIVLLSVLQVYWIPSALTAEDDQINGSPLWLLNQEVRSDNPSTNSRLSELLMRIGPNMRSSSDYHDFSDIKLNDSMSAWQLMHHQAELYAQNQIRIMRPRLLQLFNEAQVSDSCKRSVKITLNALEQLDSGAVKMWSATGNLPPVGMLDGQYTEVSGYRGCLDATITRGRDTSSWVNYTSYCTLSFRPIVPSRPKFHMLFDKESSSLLNLFNETDIFRYMAEKAQYFYYIYWKMGICVPYECSSSDIQQVANHIGRKLILMSGPVKCFTNAVSTSNISEPEIESGSIENAPILVELNKAMNRKQAVASIMILTFFGIVFMATFWHLIELEFKYYNEEKTDHDKSVKIVVKYHGIKHIAFNYFSMVTNTREFFNISTVTNEIRCLHGLRVLTMLWIIVVHTLQYSEWSSFARIFEVENILRDITLHPIYNANYTIDNFFFMSGLLAAYSTFQASKKNVFSYSILTHLINRYLRLTPQVLLISLLYMVLPRAGNGPFWYDTTHHASKYCEKNWWVNLLHLQSFYRKDEMCNLVGWWISVDMFYYIIALGIVFMTLKQQKIRAILSSTLLVCACLFMSAYQHFQGGYTPNNLGSVPQVGEVWTNYVVNFVWTPMTHAFPFFLGLLSSYVLANNKWQQQVKEHQRIGWTLALICLAGVNLSSYIWLSGAVKLGSQYVSTFYNTICAILWSTAYAWVVIACHYDACVPALNKFLSFRLFVLLSKASFIIYLSHMLVVRIYFGLQLAVLEVSTLAVCYVIIGNIFLSTILGIFLCISFEGPCMKLQRFIAQKIKPQRAHTYLLPGMIHIDRRSISDDPEEKLTIQLNASAKTLLK